MDAQPQPLVVDPVDPNLDRRDPDESFLHLPFRLPEPAIHQLLDELQGRTEELFAELGDVTAGARDEHNDLFRVARAQRLTPGYAAGFSAMKRSKVAAATGIHVVSGRLEVTSKSPKHPHSTVRRSLGPGERCVLRDDESHIIAAPEGADVLQIVTPRLHWGRSFVLPELSGWVKPDRTVSAAAFRGRLARVANGVDSVSRVMADRWAMSLVGKLPSRTPRKIQQQRRIMFVHAHPDDESSKGAATMAELVAQGHEVTVVTCTGGEQGSLLNPDLEHLDPDEVVGRRPAEMDAALRHLGVKHRWLGYRDSGMPADGVAAPDTFAAQTGAAARGLAQVIRELRPDVLVTYNETGGYPHLDHKATHEVSVAAMRLAAAAGRSDLEGAPHTVAKMYYHVPFDPKTIRLVHRRLLAEGRESPFGRQPLHPPRPITARVRVRIRSVLTAERALASHRTQVNDQSPWSLLSLSHRRVENFERAVPPHSPGERETSLLAGLPGTRRRQNGRKIRLRVISGRKSTMRQPSA